MIRQCPVPASACFFHFVLASPEWRAALACILQGHSFAPKVLHGPWPSCVVVLWLKQLVFCCFLGVGALQWLKLVSPQRLVVVDLWAQVAGPSFFERFRACLQQSFVFFGHHDELRDWKEYPHILWMEDHFIGQCIVNIVAGEGRQRVFHLEPRSAVRSVLTKVGFKGSDLEKDAVASVREGLIGCNLPSCGLKAIEGDTLALNWVGQPLTYMSSFKL